MSGRLEHALTCAHPAGYKVPTVHSLFVVDVTVGKHVGF